MCKVSKGRVGWWRGSLSYMEGVARWTTVAGTQRRESRDAGEITRCRRGQTRQRRWDWTASIDVDVSGAVCSLNRSTVLRNNTVLRNTVSILETPGAAEEKDASSAGKPVNTPRAGQRSGRTPPAKSVTCV